MFLRALVILSLLSTFTGEAARAESPPDAYYAAGIKAFEANDFSEAAKDFAASMRVRPDAKTAIYLGNAHLKLEQLGQAKEAFEQALKIDPQNAKRDDILKLIKNIDSRNIGFVKIATAPTHATIYLHDQGNRALGKTPAKLTLPVGPHRVVLKSKGYESAGQDVTVSLGKTENVELALRRATCELGLSATPAGSLADVDGTGMIKVPAKIRVARGEHRVRFSALGFIPQEISVTCEGDTPSERVDVKAQLGRPKRHRAP